MTAFEKWVCSHPISDRVGHPDELGRVICGKCLGLVTVRLTLPLLRRAMDQLLR